ncbi:MAG: hypothetical protein ACW98I_01340 [Candidatus Hodarchaeales archaeon]
MTEKQTTGYSEGIVGVRVKRFLGLSVINIAKELLKQIEKSQREKALETIILPLVRETFSLSAGDNPTAQAKLYLASLGFSPCEIDWKEDTRIGTIHLGKGRIWRSSSEKEEKLVKSLLLIVVKGLGFAFMGTNVQASFTSSEALSPRFTYEIQFRATEDVFAEVIGTEEDIPGVSLSITVLLEPILGTGIRAQDAARFLIEATRIVVGEQLPSLLERKDIIDKPLKILELFYINLDDSEKLKRYAHQIGKIMVRNIRLEFPNLKNHQLLKGIGLLPIEELDELLFYGSVEICGIGERGSNISFCRFLGQLWSGYASEVLNKQFQMDEDPLCAGGTGTKCIFTLSEVTDTV